jgi:hypothetical protein
VAKARLTPREDRSPRTTSPIDQRPRQFPDIGGCAREVARCQARRRRAARGRDAGDQGRICPCPSKRTGRARRASLIPFTFSGLQRDLEGGTRLRLAAAPWLIGWRRGARACRVASGSKKNRALKRARCIVGASRSVYFPESGPINRIVRRDIWRFRCRHCHDRYQCCDREHQREDRCELHLFLSFPVPLRPTVRQVRRALCDAHHTSVV